MPTRLKNILAKRKLLLSAAFVVISAPLVVLLAANQVKAQLDADRYAPLAEQKAVTRQEYDNAVQANVAARAQVKAAEAGVETARGAPGRRRAGRHGQGGDCDRQGADRERQGRCAGGRA